ncbi:MAG TPA: hypothetical protein VK463_05865 [Desulfomonilaceae bacterium]|nr:hypothetical protein [Desulfomonilaceae bacterium]
MQARYADDSTIAVSGARRTEQFNRIWAGIGWPDREPGYLCVVGERTDGLLHALWEKHGGLWELGEGIIEAKDRFLIECIWVDTSDEVATSYLRTREGLCFYDDPASEPSASGISWPASRWPHFRDRDVTATIAAVPVRIVKNYRSALEETRGVLMTGRLMVHESNCPKLVYTLRQPVRELLGSSVMKALVWVISALEAAKGVGQLDFKLSDPWYTNFSRDLD